MFAIAIMENDHNSAPSFDVCSKLATTKRQAKDFIDTLIEQVRADFSDPDFGEVDTDFEEGKFADGHFYIDVYQDGDVVFSEEFKIIEVS